MTDEPITTREVEKGGMTGTGRKRLSDDQIIARVRHLTAFQKLRDILGDDQKALDAMRAEGAYIAKHPNTPRGDAIAIRVRQWLLDNRLGWTEENLARAIEATATK